MIGQVLHFVFVQVAAPALERVGMAIDPTFEPPEGTTEDEPDDESEEDAPQ